MSQKSKKSTTEQYPQEAAERYGKLVESSPYAIVIHIDGKVIFANKAAAKMVGVKNIEKHIGRSIYDFVHPDSAQLVKDRMALIQKGKTPPTVEERFVRLDGSSIYAEVTSIPTIYHGEAAVQVIIKDITEQKLARQALQETNQALKAIFQASPQAIIALDLSGKVTMWNKAAERIFGWSRAQRVGNVLPIDQGRSEIKQYLSATVKGKSFTNIETKMRNNRGLVIDVKFSTAPLTDSQDKVNGLVAVLDDITERKKAQKALEKSESRYRSLFEDSPISLWEEDFSDIKTFIDCLKSAGIKDFKKYFDEHPEVVSTYAKMFSIIDVNKATLKLYKAKSKEELYDNLPKIFGRDYDNFKKELVAIAKGKKQFETECINYTIEEEPRNIYLKWIIPKGSKETMAKVLVAVIDQSGQKK
ncbi:MAG: PAS domain S-box protein [Actinobacteria bacterium]|nr:MAG: PAS domain S-box protein [Actinomycetota bacterium]